MINPLKNINRFHYTHEQNKGFFSLHILLSAFFYPVALEPSSSVPYSQTGTLLSIQSYADCGSREVGRKLGRWNATCLLSLLKTLVFLRRHKLPTKSSPARAVRPASERKSKLEPTSAERHAWKHNTKTGEIRQKAWQYFSVVDCLFCQGSIFLRFFLL